MNEKNVQTGDMNLPKPQSVKKLNKISVILLVMALICFILFNGVVPVVIGWVLLIAAFIINAKYRVKK
jgi:hypothetical protein